MMGDANPQRPFFYNLSLETFVPDDHLLGNESQLLVFAADYRIAPELIGQAHAVLDDMAGKGR